jgi:hypothetical protein
LGGVIVRSVSRDEAIPIGRAFSGPRLLRSARNDTLEAEDERAVSEWVSLNTDALVAYWEGRIDTVQLGQALKRLPSAQPGSASVP